MDEVTRRLEREALESPEARARLAQHYLRGARYQDVVELTAGEAPVGDLAGARCAALFELGQVGEAADAAGRAEGAVHVELVGSIAAALLDPLPAERLARLHALRRCAELGEGAGELLAAFVDDPDPLARAQVARHPRWREALRSDPVAVVRYLAQGAPSVVEFPREPLPTRLFSAHGPDFLTGHFVAFHGSAEARLRLFDAALFHTVADLLGVGEHAVLARGRGYGLGIPRGAPVGEIEERLAAITAADLLPLALEVGSGHMFDHLVPKERHEADAELAPEDALLADMFARDLDKHPARLDPHPDGVSLLYAELLKGFHPARAPVDLPEALLEQASATYGPLGAAALRRFVVLAKRQSGRQRRVRNDPTAS